MTKFFTASEYENVARLDIARHRVRLWYPEAPRTITGPRGLIDIVTASRNLDEIIAEISPQASWQHVNIGHQPVLWVDREAIETLYPFRGRMMAV